MESAGLSQLLFVLLVKHLASSSLGSANSRTRGEINEMARLLEGDTPQNETLWSEQRQSNTNDSASLQDGASGTAAGETQFGQSLSPRAITSMTVNTSKDQPSRKAHSSSKSWTGSSVKVRSSKSLRLIRSRNKTRRRHFSSTARGCRKALIVAGRKHGWEDKTRRHRQVARSLFPSTRHHVIDHNKHREQSSIPEDNTRVDFVSVRREDRGSDDTQTPSDGIKPHSQNGATHLKARNESSSETSVNRLPTSSQLITQNPPPEGVASQAPWATESQSIPDPSLATIIKSEWCQASYTMYVGRLYKVSCVGAEFKDAPAGVRYLVPDVENIRLNGANFQRFSTIVEKGTPAKVSSLYLEDSNVRSIDDVFSIFDSRFILTLNLSNNSVEQLGAATFNEAVNLEYLDLSNNHIAQVEASTFPAAQKLKYLFLRNNKLTRLDASAFANNSLLQEIHLDNNNILSLETGSFAGLAELMYLYLSDNPLSDQLINHPGLFAPCVALHTLSLNRCQISEVNRQTFLGLTKLHTLNLSWNNLTTLAPGTFAELSTLVSLYLEHNMMLSVSASWSLPHTFKILSLASNRIQQIDDGFFDGMDLDVVFLNSNKLSTLSTLTQMYLATRQNMTLYDNPWRCDCDLVYLISHVTSQAHSPMNNVTCFYPRHIRMSDIRAADVMCPLERNCPQAVCPPCPRGLQRRVDGSCVCMEGTQPYSGQMGKSGCHACPALHYKPSPGNGPCLPCSIGSTAVMGPAPVCSCSAGYFTNGRGDCEKCSEGTYKPYVGVGPCIQCTATTSHLQQCSVVQQEPGPVHGAANTEARDDVGSAMWPAVAAVVAVLVVCVLVALVVFVRRYHQKRHHLKRYKNSQNIGSTSLHHFEGDSQNSHCSASSSSSADYRCGGRYCLRIKSIGNMVGQGAFGHVYEGSAYLKSYDKDPVRVAVKRLKDSATDEEVRSMREEMEQMLNVGPHANIISLYGSVLYEGQMCIVMEFAELGDLLTYLKTECAFPLQYVRVGSDGLVVEQSAPQVEDNANLMMFAWQIAKGMRHLEIHRFIHRDLAARNCLLTRGPIAKVSDFGLSKDAYELGHYKRVQKDRVPFKWLSPEALLWGQYSSKSDVWAFGILLWELYTFGGTPYPQVTTEQLRELLENGYRMSKPPACPEQLYRIMRACWREDPRQRPNFRQLVQTLDNLAQKTSDREYLDLHPHGLKSSNPLPFTQEDLDDSRTSLELVYKQKKLNSYQSRNAFCEVTYDNMAATISIFSKHNNLLYNEIFPLLTEVNDKTSDDSSKGSTVTSGFQSLSSAQTM